MKKTQILLIAAATGMAVGACLVFLILPAFREPTEPLPDQDLLESAFRTKMDWSVPQNTRVILIPHHIVAAREIASLVSATPKPSRVILVVPDHFASCGPRICSVDVAHPKTDADAAMIQKEHAVSGLLPYLRHAWGNDVPIAAVLVRPDLPDIQTDGFASTTARFLEDDPGALLVVSIDASHYLPAEVADFHDVMTQSVIESLAIDDVTRTEIDAPSVLRIGLKAARALGLGHVTVHGHTNALRLLKASLSFESTSHLFASFAPGEIAPRSVTTALVFGDATAATGATMTARLKTLRGAEGRLFYGQDAMAVMKLPPGETERAMLFKAGFTEFDADRVGTTVTIGIESDDVGRFGRDGNRFAVSSLGDFLLAPSAASSSFDGFAVGIVSSPQGDELHLFPLGTDDDGNILLLTGKERQAWLDLHAELTEDISLSSDIRQGVLRSTH
jgi:AmmeMemoRadiSam system protein B